MKFLVIIPAYNEEKNIFFCLESLKNQSFKDFVVVVVNDGSSDKTANVVEEMHLPKNFKVKNLPASTHEPGAKVVRTFYKGLESIDLQYFDIICKFDADIIFPPDYLMRLNEIYIQNPKVGMVSGIVKIKKSVFEHRLAFDFKDEKKQWQYENLSSKDHVRGPIKSYRKECFQAIGGLRPMLGWDNIDVMLAKMHDWGTVTIKDLWVKHLRPTAYKYKNQKAEKLGEYFYNIGLDFPLAAISSAKSSLKNRSVSEFFITLKNYLKQNGKQELSADEVRYIRKLRWRTMLNKFNKK